MPCFRIKACKFVRWMPISSAARLTLPLAALQGFGQKSPFELFHGRVADLLLELLELLPVRGSWLTVVTRRGLADFVGQVVRLDAVLVAEYGQPLDDVSQLADIARPGVAFHQAHGLGAETLDADLVLLAETLQEGNCQQGISPCRSRSGGRKRGTTLSR